MWLRRNKLALIAPEPLVAAPQRLAVDLNQAYWAGWPDNRQPWQFLDEALTDFRDAARNEIAP